MCFGNLNAYRLHVKVEFAVFMLKKRPLSPFLHEVADSFSVVSICQFLCLAQLQLLRRFYKLFFQVLQHQMIPDVGFGILYIGLTYFLDSLFVFVGTISQEHPVSQAYSSLQAEWFIRIITVFRILSHIDIEVSFFYLKHFVDADDSYWKSFGVVPILNK